MVASWRTVTPTCSSVRSGSICLTTRPSASSWFSLRRRPTRPTAPAADVMPLAPRSAVPALRSSPHYGEHSREVLLEVGFAPHEVDALLEAKAVVAR